MNKSNLQVFKLWEERKKKKRKRGVENLQNEGFKRGRNNPSFFLKNLLKNFFQEY